MRRFGAGGMKIGEKVAENTPTTRRFQREKAVRISLDLNWIQRLAALCGRFVALILLIRPILTKSD
jgi:hypothetical protein